MTLDASPKFKELETDVDYGNLPYPNPKTPQEEFANDIVISLREVKAGKTRSSAESLRILRKELGLNAD